MHTTYAIGIDFGTANSCVAYAAYHDRGDGEVDPDPLHRPEVIPFHNRETIPTAFHLGDGQKVPPAFGKAAEERALLDPQRFYTGFKLNLAKPDAGRDAFLMTKYFLGYLLRRVGQFVPYNAKDPSISVQTIVGHPVQWDADQREATLRAAEEAGFPNVRLEEESLAALYCHIFDERAGFELRPGSHVMTIDMGGGTTDFAFLQIPSEPGQRPISTPVHPAPEENRSYGGRVLDLLLLSHFSRFWRPEVVQQNSRALLREIRTFKEAFSNHLTDGWMEYENRILVGDRPERVHLTREQFERMAADYIKYFEVLVRGALDEAGLKPEQVSQLILTGGHSRWYFVERTLGQVFPHLFVGHHTIFRHSNPEQSVARGLAYDPLARSNRSGFLTPKRRAAHGVWLQFPAASSNGLTRTGDPVLLMPRGTLLPYQTEQPVRIHFEQQPAEAGDAKVTLRFLSGTHRVPLADRTATFHRSFWEQLTMSLSSRLWGAGSTDEFDVSVHLGVDEHELITAEMEIKRARKGKVLDVQREQLQVNISAAQSRSALGD